MKKNDNINVTIKNYGCNAEGVANFDGKTVFVPYSLVGENLNAIIIKENSKYCIGKITEILKKSENRIEAPCPYFAKCGGCQLQHTNYENSLKIKTEIVQNAINSIGKIDWKIPQVVASKNTFHYRNKIAMPINPKTRRLGMYRPNSHKIIDIEDCILQKNIISSLISAINEYLSKSQNTIFDDETKKGLLKSVVAREIEQKLIVTVVINGDKLPDEKLLIDTLSQKFGDNLGINLNINKLKNNVVLTENFVDIFGNNQIEIEEFGIKYSINNQSFLQVNDDVKKEMYQKIFDEIDDEVVVDCYSGAGLLSAMIARHAKKVFGIEIVKEATNIANRLKEQNAISNLTNINGDCSVELSKLTSELPKQDEITIVLDPPRKGCDKNVLETICKNMPAKIIYMSCDPSTLARDLKILLESGNYKIKYIQPFDMFPQTKHVETLAVLEKI